MQISFPRPTAWGRRVIVLVASFAAATGQLGAQPPPDGAELQVNTYTTSIQGDASVAFDGTGGFFVVWESQTQDGSVLSVQAQRYAADGSAAGAEFQINTYTPLDQDDPVVAGLAGGGFVVVWESYEQDESGDSVQARRFAADGSAIGDEFQINTYTTESQDSPAVATAPDGAFVVVWESDAQDGSYDSVHAQRFGSGGSPVGGELAVNTFTTADQDDPVVAIDAGGAFVVAWESYAQDGSDDSIQARRFAADGSPVGSEFQVNTFTTGSQTAPAVAADPDGNLVIVWQSSDQDGDGNGVHGQRFDSDGLPVGDEFQINVFTTGDQDTASVAIGPTGGFIAVWESNGSDGDGDSVQARLFRADGIPVGGEFQVNTFTTADQEDAVASVDADGNFVVAWESFDQDGSADSVHAQRYQALLFVDGFETGDTSLWSTTVSP